MYCFLTMWEGYGMDGLLLQYIQMDRKKPLAKVTL
ncbi:hypothetical protein CLU90_5833 [Janthinobacterium sp. 67]|nr:hypothetical protein CLU90_5833 [Janthinobacterium sp. 67]SIR90922.1 hypothetical protein SAMN05880566_14115 [Janthinobacterium sp. TND4EL3]